MDEGLCLDRGNCLGPSVFTWLVNLDGEIISFHPFFILTAAGQWGTRPELGTSGHGYWWTNAVRISHVQPKHLS